MLNDWGIFNTTSQTAFCDYLEKQYEELDKGSDELAPCCKERILRKQQRLCLKDMMRWSGGVFIRRSGM